MLNKHWNLALGAIALAFALGTSTGAHAQKPQTTAPVIAAATATAKLPAGMVRVVIPASKRAVFDVEPGRMDLVGAKWMEIWGHTELAKTVIAEYEHYRADGKIAISIGLQ